MMIFAGTMPPPAEDESMAPRWNRFVTIIGIALVTCDLPPASAQQTSDPLAQLNNAVQDMVQKVPLLSSRCSCRNTIHRLEVGGPAGGWATRAYMTDSKRKLYNTAKAKLLSGQQVFSHTQSTFDIKQY